MGVVGVEPSLGFHYSKGCQVGRGLNVPYGDHVDEHGIIPFFSYYYLNTYSYIKINKYSDYIIVLYFSLVLDFIQKNLLEASFGEE